MSPREDGAASAEDMPRVVAGGRFELERRLGRGGMGEVFAAVDRETGNRVALKSLRDFRGVAIDRFKQEFRTLVELQHPNLIRLGELLCVDDEWFFTMELVEGETLISWVRGDGCGESMLDSASETADTRYSLTVPAGAASNAGSEATRPLLDLAPAAFNETRLRDSCRQLSSALMAVHRAGRVHRDVKPSNVMVRNNGHVVLLDFGLVLDVARGAVGAIHGTRLAGTPGYMAPEQVLGSDVGPAADWYAFGVLLFRALTGRLPFEGDTDHVMRAKRMLVAPRPSQFVSGVPQDLDGLCHQLLDRDPTQRPIGGEVYACLGGEPISNELTPMVDSSVPFVGRHAELAQLRRAWSEVGDGKAAHVLVRGEPGMGKTALVRELLTNIKAETPRPLVLQGRCYEQESLPFKGFDAIVDGLAAYLLRRPSDEVAALIESGVAYLAAVFPAIKTVPLIGAEAPRDRPVASPADLRAHAFSQLRALLTAVATSRPLALFVDDVQWADNETHALMEALSGDDGPPCLIVATARSDADPSAPAGKWMTAFRELRLLGLTSDESRALVRELGAIQLADDSALDEFQGHPLLLAELARYGDTAAAGNASGLEEMLWHRVAALDGKPRRLLELSAMLGVPVKYDVLAQVAELDDNECLALLHELRNAQLVRITRKGDMRLIEPYHDRIREAILHHSELGENAREKKLLNRRIGRLLLETTADERLPEQIFTILRHLNLAQSVCVEVEERIELAALNGRGAVEAKRLTAYERALAYVDTALDLLPAEVWQKHGALARDLHRERMECQYLTGDVDGARRSFELLRAHEITPTDVARLYEIKIEYDTVQGRLDEAVDTARHGLSALGVKLPAKVSKLSVLRNLLAVKWHTRGRAPHELLLLPSLADETLSGALSLLEAVAPAAMWVDKNLLALSFLRTVSLSLQHGLSADSAYGFAGYGYLLSSAMGRHEEAFRFGELAEQIYQRFDANRLGARIKFINAAGVTPWVRPGEAVREQIDSALELARRSGDLAYEAYCASAVSAQAFYASPTLEQGLAEAERAFAIAHKRHNSHMRAICDAHRRFHVALLGHTSDPTRLALPDSPEDDLVSAIDERDAPIAACWLWMLRCQLFALFGRDRQARASLAEAERRLPEHMGMVSIAEHYAFAALLAGRSLQQGAKPRRRLRRQIGRSANKLRAWTHLCPKSFQHMYELARAEGLAAGGRQREALAAFCGAAELAEARRAHKFEGIALERATDLADKVEGQRAETLRQRAIDAYRRWGAKAKVDSMTPATSR